MSRYRFKIRHGAYRPGDLVPLTYGPGIVQTMLDACRIEVVPELTPSSEERTRSGEVVLGEWVPENKAIKPSQVKAKGKR